MKTKLIMAALVAAAAAATLAGCMKDDGNPGIAGGDDGRTTTVLLKAGAAAMPASRAVADRVIDGTPITIQPGWIFFVDVTGEIRRKVEVIATGASTADAVAIDDIRDGATITEVPTAVTTAYMFSNIPTENRSAVAAVSVGNNISLVQNIVMKVEAMSQADGGVTAVPQWGTGSVAEKPDDPTKYATTIALYAMGSRLQVVKMSTRTAAEGQVITDYDVDGIFVNNYFKDMRVGYTGNSSITNNLSSIPRYGVTGAANHYVAPYDVLADYNAGFDPKLGTVSGTETSAGTDKVWAYNVWPTAGMVTPSQATIPHIVIRLSGIKWKENESATEEQTITEPMFITVRGIRGTDGVLEYTERGRAYTFSNIIFSYDNLTTVPEETVIDTEVTIEPINWDEVPVEVVF
jgi:hypothetical protein